MKTTGAYPRLRVDTADVAATGHAGGVLLTESARVAGLDRVPSAGLPSWRKPFAVHDLAAVRAELGV